MLIFLSWKSLNVSESEIVCSGECSVTGFNWVISIFLHKRHFTGLAKWCRLQNLSWKIWSVQECPEQQSNGCGWCDLALKLTTRQTEACSSGSLQGVKRSTIWIVFRPFSFFPNQRSRGLPSKDLTTTFKIGQFENLLWTAVDLAGNNWSHFQDIYSHLQWGTKHVRNTGKITDWWRWYSGMWWFVLIRPWLFSLPPRLCGPSYWFLITRYVIGIQRNQSSRNEYFASSYPRLGNNYVHCSSCAVSCSDCAGFMQVALSVVRQTYMSAYACGMEMRVWRQIHWCGRRCVV